MADTPTNWNGNYSGQQIDALLAKANTSVQPSDLTSINTNISTLQSGKVDKVTGKDLSTNDFTDAEKAKLAKCKTIWIGTQAEYEALESTNDYDEYHIKEDLSADDTSSEDVSGG